MLNDVFSGMVAEQSTAYIRISGWIPNLVQKSSLCITEAYPVLTDLAHQSSFFDIAAIFFFCDLILFFVSFISFFGSIFYVNGCLSRKCKMGTIERENCQLPFFRFIFPFPLLFFLCWMPLHREISCFLENVECYSRSNIVYPGFFCLPDAFARRSHTLLRSRMWTRCVHVVLHLISNNILIFPPEFNLLVLLCLYLIEDIFEDVTKCLNIKHFEALLSQSQWSDTFIHAIFSMLDRIVKLGSPFSYDMCGICYLVWSCLGVYYSLAHPLTRSLALCSFGLYLLGKWQQSILQSSIFRSLLETLDSGFFVETSESSPFFFSKPSADMASGVSFSIYFTWIILLDCTLSFVYPLSIVISSFSSVLKALSACFHSHTIVLLMTLSLESCYRVKLADRSFFFDLLLIFERVLRAACSYFFVVFKFFFCLFVCLFHLEESIFPRNY